MATPPRSGAIAIPFLLAGLICGLFSIALLSCGGGGAGSGDLRSWSAAISLDNSSAGQFVPDVAVDGNGNAIAVWFQSDGSGTFNVWASRYVLGQGWGPPGPIQTEAAIATGCRVSMDPDGNAIVTWVQMDFLPGHGSNIWAPSIASGRDGMPRASSGMTTPLPQTIHASRWTGTGTPWRSGRNFNYSTRYLSEPFGPTVTHGEQGGARRSWSARKPAVPLPRMLPWTRWGTASLYGDSRKAGITLFPRGYGLIGTVRGAGRFPLPSRRPLRYL